MVCLTCHFPSFVTTEILLDLKEKYYGEKEEKKEMSVAIFDA